MSLSAQISEEEVFFEVFRDLFTINYTNNEGWVELTDYDIDYPSDWTLNTIGIRLNLPKQLPSVDNYQESIHELNLNASQPVFQFLINSNEFYYPYSFLSGMEITKIDIEVKVEELKSIKMKIDGFSVTSFWAAFPCSIYEHVSNVHLLFPSS